MTSQADIEQFLKEYSEAFARANPLSEMQPLSYENGWYVFRNRHHGGVSSRHRRIEMERFKKSLELRTESVS